MDTLPRTSAPVSGLCKRSRGQAFVEFALILPLFLFLLLLAVDFGRLLFTYIQLNNVAREATAYAAANPGTDDFTLTGIAQREANVQAQRGESAISAAATCVDSTGGALLCKDAGGGTGAGNRITVSASETFSFLTPIIGSYWPGGLQVATSATAAVANYAPGGGTPPAECTTKPSTPGFTWSTPNNTSDNPILEVNAGISPNLPSPCQNIGYNWSFGGLSFDNYPYDPDREGVIQAYHYGNGGTYIVTLTVSNAAGDSPTVSQTITLGTVACKAPIATINVVPAAIYKKGVIDNWVASNGNNATKFTFDGRTSAFMADGKCLPEWSWVLGDGTTASTSMVTDKTYGNSYSGKTVTVKLTVKNIIDTDFTTVDLPLK